MNRAIKETPLTDRKRKKRARWAASRKAMITAIPLAAASITIGLIAHFLKNHPSSLSASSDQRAPAYHAEAEVASFSYERRDDFGNRIESSIDCPGTQICVVEIRADGASIARANLSWDIIEPFFTYFSTTHLATAPKENSFPGGRELIRWRFKKGMSHSEGTITDESRYRSVIPAWDAMILSFI